MSKLLYTPQGLEDIKKKSGLKNEKINDKQVTELYEIACEKVSHFTCDFPHMNILN